MVGLKRKPAKPYAEFPLFAHACGQWAKKIKGRFHYFGVWSDPDAALKRYLAERDFLQVGLKPPTDGDTTTLFDLCDQFLTAKKQRLESGELGLRNRQFCLLCDTNRTDCTVNRPIQSYTIPENFVQPLIQVLLRALVERQLTQWRIE